MVISFSDWSLAIGARLMARDLMQQGSARNSLDGLAAPGQGGAIGPWVNGQGRRHSSP
jgi:hypothetical protein